MLQAVFPSLEELNVIAFPLYEIWGNSGHDNVTSSFCKLKRIHIQWWKNPETVIPLSMSNKLRNLESLKVSYCAGLRNVFQHSFVTRDLINLKEIEIYDCHRLINLFQHSSMVRDLINLQTLDISFCTMMRVIIDGKEEEAEEKIEEDKEEEEEEITDDKDITFIVFPKVTYLHLEQLQCLTSFHRSGDANHLKVIFLVSKLINFNFGSCVFD